MCPSLNTHELLDRIYQSAIAPDIRPGILQDLCVQLGMTRAMYWTVFDLHSKQACWIDFGCDASDVLEYRSYYHQHDLWVQKARQLGLNHEGALVNSDAIVPLAELKSSEIYNDSLRHSGVERALTIGIGQRSLDDALYMLTFHAGASHGEFQPAEIALLQTLGPHFARANKLAQSMQQAQLQQTLLVNTLDQIDQAVLICDRDARVDVLNLKAESWLQHRRWASIEYGRLVLRETQAQAQLQHLLRQPLAQWQDQGLVPLCDAASGQTRHVIRVLPLPASAKQSGYGLQTHFLLLIGGSGTHADKTQLLRAIYQLTPAEAQLAADLARGLSLSEIAAARQLSIHTVHSALKIIFSKTGCRRQAELLAKLQKFG